jgi:hypothetical protein
MRMKTMTTSKTLWLSGLLLAMAGEIGASEPLDELRWNARPLVLFADRPDDPDVTALKHRIEEAADAFNERRMVLIEVYGDEGRIDHRPLSEEQVVELHRRFKPPDGESTIILLGLDGGEKMRTAAHEPLGEIFDLIDSMPMRRQELR